jgi:hypothetical protein
MSAGVVQGLTEKKTGRFLQPAGQLVAHAALARQIDHNPWEAGGSPQDGAHDRSYGVCDRG